MHDKATFSLAGTSTGAAAISWISQLDLALHYLASVIAIVAGLLSIYSWWKSRKAA